MADQCEPPAQLGTRRLVAFAAGKGGCGSSALATNIGVFLAQIGKRVVLVDANLPNASLRAWLGLAQPAHSISDLLQGRILRAADALVETPIAGLSLLAGAPDLVGSQRLSEEDALSLIEKLGELSADFILVDLPAGTTPLSVTLFGAADIPVAVALATPDAIEATYRFFCATYLAALRRDPALDQATAVLLEGFATRPGKPVHPRELQDALAAGCSPFAGRAAEIAERFHPQLVVNQVRIKVDEALGEAMVAAAVRWLGLVPRWLGNVDWDDNVWLSLRRARPILVDFPQSRACRGFERIVRRLLGLDAREIFGRTLLPPPTSAQNLYELLEIYPGASEEEVRRALKRIRDFFGSSSLAVQGACTETECTSYQRAAEEAHATLVDRSKRRPYDRMTFPDGFPSGPKERFEASEAHAEQRVSRPQESLPRVEPRDDELVDGAFLSRVRRELGVDLVDISNRAKISVGYLEAIEQERFDDLPAPVYVRGFVTEFARYLKIDPGRAAADFLAKFEAARRRRHRERERERE